MLKHLITFNCIFALLFSSWASASMSVYGLSKENGNASDTQIAQTKQAANVNEQNTEIVPPCHRVESSVSASTINAIDFDTATDSSNGGLSPASHDCCGDKADCSCDGLCNSLSNGLTSSQTSFAESLTTRYQAKLSTRWDSATPPSLFRPPIR